MEAQVLRGLGRLDASSGLRRCSQVPWNRTLLLCVPGVTRFQQRLSTLGLYLSPRGINLRGCSLGNV